MKIIKITYFQISDSCSNSSCGSKSESVVETSRLAPQCWHEQVGQSLLNHGSSYTSLPNKRSPNMECLECHGRPRNGHLLYSMLPYITLQSSDKAGTHPIIAHDNERDWNIPRQQNGRKFVHFHDGKKTILQQQAYPPKVVCTTGSPVTIHELQASPVHKGMSRVRYNYHSPRKPPRSYSQTSLTKNPTTRGSYSSLCSSASQPYSHTTRGTAEWVCPQAPLAEDEVKDAYALLKPNGG